MDVSFYRQIMNLEDSAHLYQRKGMASFYQILFKNMYWCLDYLWYWISNVHVKTMSGWSLIKLFVITFFRVGFFLCPGTSAWNRYIWLLILLYMCIYFIFRLAEIILWFYMWNYSRNFLFPSWFYHYFEKYLFFDQYCRMSWGGH